MKNTTNALKKNVSEMTRKGTYHPLRTGAGIYLYFMYFFHNYSNLCWKLHVLINNFYLAAWNFCPYFFVIFFLFFFTHPSIYTFSPSFSSIVFPCSFYPLHLLCSSLIEDSGSTACMWLPPCVLACDGGTVVFSSFPFLLTDADQTGACPH